MKSGSDEHFSSRKFILAMSFTVVGSIALLAGKLGGGEFIGMAGVVLGLYGSANVADRAVRNGFTTTG